MAVEANLRSIGVDDRAGVLEVALRVAIDLRRIDHRALAGAPRRVTDPRGVVADDEHSQVSLSLERRHALQRDPVPEGHIGRGDVDPQLHA